MKTIIYVLVFLDCFSAFGQSLKYHNYKYTWDEQVPSPIMLDPIFAREDAVILDEKINYNAGGNIAPNSFYVAQSYNQFVVRESSVGLSPVVSKKIRIKYLTQKGIDGNSTFILPESFDPSGDFYSVKSEDRDSILRPKGEFECVRYFAARIITPEGKIKEAQVKESTQQEIDRYNQVDRKFYSWIFQVSNLNPGDELELAFAYEGVYNKEESKRIFFNGQLPKQNYRLTFHYPSRDVYIMNYYNKAEPTDSTMVTEGHPSYTEYVFVRKNLMACINETGGRPYTQLPYISFYKHNLDFGQADDKTKFITKPLPYPWWFIVFPFTGFQVQNVKDHFSSTDRTTVAINNFLDEEKRKVRDTSMAVIMSSVHHTIATEFNYDSDIGSYTGDRQELENLGKYVERKILRRESRMGLYGQLFARLDRDYFSVIFYDKRIAYVNPDRFDVLNSSRSGYATTFKDNIIYFYPKSSRYGYETNELPFYYEDINVLLIPQHEPYMKQFDVLPKVNFLTIKTPYSTENENTRTASSMVNVSIDSMSMKFELRLKIAGQFSTLIRPYYLNFDKDTTISPDYYNLITDAADVGSRVDTRVVSTDKIFPFEASINSSFRANSKLKREGKNYNIELGGLFNNLVDTKFSAVIRHLDYYPDFKSTDIHRYMFKFDHAIKLENVNELQTEIKNSFGEYSVKINQKDEKSIFIETILIVKAEVVRAEFAKDVSEIFNAIKKINNSSLYLTRL